jgi:RNA polymerase subunit RPABC4/transcription elongation factor Spt4
VGLKGFRRALGARRSRRDRASGGVDRFGEGDLSAQDPDGRGARDRETTPAVLPTEALQVGDLAGRERERDAFADGVPPNLGDRARGRRVPRTSVTPRRRPVFVHDLDRSVVDEQLIHDAVPVGRIPGADPEEYVPRGKPVVDLTREQSDRFGGFEIPRAQTGRAHPYGVSGLGSRIDPHDDLSLPVAGFERMLDGRAERPMVALVTHGEDVLVVDETRFRRRREDDGDAFRYSLSGEKAHGGPTSLPQKTRELPVESRVSGYERYRPTSHRMALTVKYRIYLAPGVPVCLHCGQLAPDGALFCPKCGFTLPQGDVGSPAPAARAGPHASGLGVSSSPPAAVPASPLSSAPPPNGAPPIAMPPPPPAATGPGLYLTRIPPPPNGKYCVRCGTLISRPAVYCPVCQQPQGP